VREQAWIPSSVFSFTLEKDVLENIAQGENAFEATILVDNYEAMYTWLADGIENGI
jgi:hypothetical protein